MKRTVLTAAIAAGLALGSGQAAAYVYADSNLSITNLTIVISPAAGATVTRFDFQLDNNASLNLVSAAPATAACGGTPGAPGPGTNNCSTTPGAVLDAAAVNAPGSTLIRPNNSTTGGEFTTFGPAVPGGLGNSTGNYSNADTLIRTAEVVTGTPTSTSQIAESLITTATQAAASAQIQSTTGFTFTFTLAAPGSLALNFSADPDLFAAIFGQPAGTFSAQANLNTSFSLQQNSGGAGTVNWNPNGTTANDCIASGGPACSETADSQDLNINVGTTTNNTSQASSPDFNTLTATPFGINITGLSAGTWTLTLNAVSSTRLAFTPAVPEPGVLALLGIGLMGLFATTRRKTLS